MAAILPTAPVLGAAGGILAGPLLAGAPRANFMQYYADASPDEYNQHNTMLLWEYLPRYPEDLHLNKSVN
jgi:hypothetical protein